jgi:hypothetical protein
MLGRPAPLDAARFSPARASLAPHLETAAA